MSDIDDKLINAICSYASGTNQQVKPERELLDIALQNIKKAFEDAGYLRVPQSYTTLEEGLKVYRVDGKIVMPGAEWYSRFIQEYNYVVKGVTVYSGDEARDLIFKAAKRASGLTN